MKAQKPILMLTLAACLTGTGCVTYKPSELWRQGNVQKAAKQFTAQADKKSKGKDSVIWRLEQGAALRAAGQHQESITAFDAAEEKINWHDEQAKTSISQEAAALFSNQANLPYEGRDYDKVMLNAYKALNYLALGNQDRARVELVRAYQRQQDAVENNKRRLRRPRRQPSSSSRSLRRNGLQLIWPNRRRTIPASSSGWIASTAISMFSSHTPTTLIPSSFIWTRCFS